MQLLRGFCHHKHIYSLTRGFTLPCFTYCAQAHVWLISMGLLQKIFNLKFVDATEHFSISGAPMPIIPGVPFTSHNNCRILYLGSDEVHSNHCCQVIHTHLVNTGVQLYFM